MSVRRVLIAGAVLFMLCPALFADIVYFPQVADGGGFSTTFTLINRNPSVVSATLRLFNQDGSPRALTLNGLTASQFPVTLSAGGSVRLVSSGSSPSISAGWASLESTPALEGVATFDYRNGGILQSSAGVLATTALTKVIVPIDHSGSLVNTGLAIANVQPTTSVTVRAKLYDEAGSVIATVDDARLNPVNGNRQVALFINELFPGASDPFKGSVGLEVIGAGGIAVTGLTIKEGLLSAIPAIDATGSSDKSFQQLQAERLLGTWNFTYTVTSQFTDTYRLSIISTSTTDPGHWVVVGKDSTDDIVVAEYSTLLNEFDLFDQGSVIDKFYTFDFTGADTVAGCYYQAPTGTVNTSQCYAMTGVRTSTSALTSALVPAAVSYNQEVAAFSQALQTRADYGEDPLLADTLRKLRQELSSLK